MKEINFQKKSQNRKRRIMRWQQTLQKPKINLYIIPNEKEILIIQQPRGLSLKKGPATKPELTMRPVNPLKNFAGQMRPSNR